MTGWQDDFTTADERRAARRAMLDIRQHREELWASAPHEARHVGDDDGAHHAAYVPDDGSLTRGCPCGCQQAGDDGESDDPLDILGRQIDSDPLTQYERGRALADIERRSAELESMRVRFSPKW